MFVMQLACAGPSRLLSLCLSAEPLLPGCGVDFDRVVVGGAGHMVELLAIVDISLDGAVWGGREGIRGCTV